MTAAAAANRLALRDLLARYARGVDRRDVPLVRTCFAPDCHYDGALGRGTVDVAIVALREAMSRYRATFHLLGEQHAELSGDVAILSTPAIAHHVLRGPETRHYTVGIRYHDTCVRGPSGWRITARRVERVWERDGLVPFE